MTASQQNAATAPTQYLTVNGTRHAYRRFGNVSAVPLIGFQHFTGTLDNWDPAILNALAEEREVIIFDNKGVGSSEGDAPDSVAEMTDDAVAFIRAMGITRFDVLGFSLGGFIAQQLGYHYPELIRKIIIVGAAPQGTTVLHGFPQLVQKAMQKDPVELFLFIFFTNSMDSRVKGKKALERLYARTNDRDQDTQEQAVLAQIKAITAWGTDPVTIDLSKIEHPVLIVQGSNDEMMNSASSYELFQQLPNAFLCYYPDSAHGSFFQYPEVFVSQAKQFLNG